MFSQALREVAANLAAMHITKASPIYEELAEGRNDWTDANGKTVRYSWCGDFVTYALVLAAADAQRQYINRVDVNGEWKIGQNISMLIEAGRANKAICYGRQAVAAMKAGGTEGFIYVIDVPNGGHVGVIDSVLSGTTYATFDGNSIGGASQRRIRSFDIDKILCVIDSNLWHGSTTIIPAGTTALRYAELALASTISTLEVNQPPSGTVPISSLERASLSMFGHEDASNDLLAAKLLRALDAHTLADDQFDES